MRIDFYTRAVLTVIALCLVWIAIGGPAVLPAAEAQGVTRVMIVGWEASGGSDKKLPLPVQVIGPVQVPGGR